MAESLLDVPSRERTLVKFKFPPDAPAPPLPIIHEKAPAIFVEPVVKMDGYSIELNVTQTIEEFVGYQAPRPDWDYVPSPGANPPPLIPIRERDPKPIYYPRHSKDSSVLWDGQTMILGGLAATNISNSNKAPLLGDLPIAGRLITSSPAKRKNLVIILTPTLVDENGKPLHQAKDLPFSENNVPPQPNW